MRLAAAAPLAALLLATLAPAAPATLVADDRELIRERLASEGPQEILVSIDATVDDAVALGLQTVAARRCEDPTGLACIQILRDRSRAKQRAVCGLEGVSLLQDFQVLAYVFVRLENEAALDALLARPDVAAVYENSELVPLSRVRPSFTPGFSCAFAPGQREAVWLWGDWNGDGAAEVGKYVPALDVFLLDVNGDGLWQGHAGGDRAVALATALGPGEPLVGDWNGDGADGVGKQVGAHVVIDANENGRWDGNGGGDRNTRFAPGRDPVVPLAADWDGDGRDEIGAYWYGGAFLLDRNGDGIWDGMAGGDRLVLVPSTHHCWVEPVAVDWDPERPGASVGVVQGGPFVGTGHALDLDEDGRFDASGADLVALLPPPGCSPILLPLGG